MGYGLGWQRVAPQNPYIDGEPFVDGLSRSLNTLSFSYNARLHVVKPTGYWNYGWFLDMQCGNIISDNRLVKPRTGGRNWVIGGVDYWQSTYNGNFNGTINIGGKDTYTTLRMTFHDDVGNWGGATYWNVSIPTATAMSNISHEVTHIDAENATISGKITSKGNYSKITRWEITCNGQTFSTTSDVDNFSHTFTGLDSKTRYTYTVKVWSSSGYSKSASGAFTTLQDEIGYLLVDGEPVKLLLGWVVTPDGRKRRIKRIKTVAPL